MKEVTTYLTFDGTTRAAMAFYGKALGIEPFFQTYAEANCGAPAQFGERIVHAAIRRGNSPILMASDVMPGGDFQQGNNFSVCIACESQEEADRLFAALGENGKVTLAMQDMFWGAYFGMLIDQFGVGWMFNFERPKAG